MLTELCGYHARMATNKPQDDYQKQGVRLPRELHERLHAAALESGRSYNSELIARLTASFTPQAPAEVVAGNRVYILIDSSGYPQSWVEINKYLAAIEKQGGIEFAQMEVFIVTPETVASSMRTAQAAELARLLRPDGKSLPGDSEHWPSNTIDPLEMGITQMTMTYPARKAKRDPAVKRPSKKQ